MQTNLNEQKRDRENEALKKASSPPITAETVPPPTITEASTSTSTTTIAKTSGQVGQGKSSAPKEKKKGEGKQKEKQANLEEIVAIESDEESGEELLIDDEAEGMSKRSTGRGTAVQSSSSNTSATQKGADARTPMEVDE